MKYYVLSVVSFAIVVAAEQHSSGVHPQKTDYFEKRTHSRFAKLQPSRGRVDPNCPAACIPVVNMVEEIFRDNAKLVKLKSVLQRMCMRMHSHRLECVIFASYLERFRRNFRPVFRDPSDFCTVACWSPAGEQMEKLFQLFNFYLQQQFMTNDANKSGWMCDQCEMACHEGREYLARPEVQSQIKDLLHFLCRYLGRDYGQICDNVCDSYFPAVIAEVETLLNDPQKFCAEIGLCTISVLAPDEYYYY